MVEYNDGYGNVYDPMEDITNRIVKKHFEKPKKVWDIYKICTVIFVIQVVFVFLYALLSTVLVDDHFILVLIRKLWQSLK